jgi:hypothetical protein
MRQEGTADSMMRKKSAEPAHLEFHSVKHDFFSLQQIVLCKSSGDILEDAIDF